MRRRLSAYLAQRFFFSFSFLSSSSFLPSAPGGVVPRSGCYLTHGKESRCCNRPPWSPPLPPVYSLAVASSRAPSWTLQCSGSLRCSNSPTFWRDTSRRSFFFLSCCGVDLRELSSFCLRATPAFQRRQRVVSPTPSRCGICIWTICLPDTTRILPHTPWIRPFFIPIAFITSLWTGILPSWTTRTSFTPPI